MEMIAIEVPRKRLSGWFIIGPSGDAENNEPLRVRHLFRRWLSREGVKVIVDLEELNQFGVWEVGLLTSFKREVDQRGGVLRLCRLNPNLSGYFQNDRFAGQFEIYDLNEIPMRVHLWLENMTRIDLGNYSLRVFHTPGHTSGCISIIETTCGLLFSADSVFAGGTLSYIAESGSIGDYLDSLARLRCFGLRALYPGHGKISTTPIQDIDQAIANAQRVLDQPSAADAQIFFQKQAAEDSDVEPGGEFASS